MRFLEHACHAELHRQTARAANAGGRLGGRKRKNAKTAVISISLSGTPESGHVQCSYRCPLWVKSGHSHRTSVCPLCANSGHDMFRGHKTNWLADELLLPAQGQKTSEGVVHRSWIIANFPENDEFSTLATIHPFCDGQHSGAKRMELH
jgi:hypothetical protein